jgi:hypothetical protein
VARILVRMIMRVLAVAKRLDLIDQPANLHIDMRGKAAVNPMRRWH